MPQSNLVRLLHLREGFLRTHRQRIHAVSEDAWTLSHGGGSYPNSRGGYKTCVGLPALPCGRAHRVLSSCCPPADTAWTLFKLDSHSSAALSFVTRALQGGDELIIRAFAAIVFPGHREVPHLLFISVPRWTTCMHDTRYIL